METVKIAILGFGTIGSGIAEVLEKQKLLITARTGKVFEVTKILDVRDFSLHPMSDRFVKSIDDIINDNSIKIVAEAIGGTEPAFEYVMKCIKSEKHVVTSNKELVASKGIEILRAADDAGTGFLFEASVGGTMPIISAMAGVLSANTIEHIDGILNGTTNFILTNMLQKKLSFDEALERAQQLGYAETIDPSADIDGIDAGRKIAILASLAYGGQFPVDKVSIEGIRGITYDDLALADAAGGAVKLIASADGSEFGDVRARVMPMFVYKTNRLAFVDDVFNMVSLKCNMSGAVEIFGRGAGKLPTAAVVVGDIIELATKVIDRPAFWTGHVNAVEEHDDILGRYFATVTSDDKELLESIRVKVDAVCSNERGVGFVTSNITGAEARLLEGKLKKHGPSVRLFSILQD